MITIKNAIKINVSLVLKLDDFYTGDAITNDSSLKVVSGDGFLVPVCKPDGYYVFTGRKPHTVRITSSKYHNALVDISAGEEETLRLSLVPRSALEVSLGAGAVPQAAISAEEGAYIGLGASSSGYGLAGALEPGAVEIKLQKDDLSDITQLYHALISPEGQAEAIFLTASTGQASYKLKSPVGQAYPIRNSRIIPLRRAIGGPIYAPPGTDAVYIFSGGKVSIMKMGESS